MNYIIKLLMTVAMLTMLACGGCNDKKESQNDNNQPEPIQNNRPSPPPGPGPQNTDYVVYIADLTINNSDVFKKLFNDYNSTSLGASYSKGLLAIEFTRGEYYVTIYSNMDVKTGDILGGFINWQYVRPYSCFTTRMTFSPRNNNAEYVLWSRSMSNLSYQILGLGPMNTSTQMQLTFEERLLSDGTYLPTPTRKFGTSYRTYQENSNIHIPQCYNYK